MRTDIAKLWSLFDRRTRLQILLLLVPIFLVSVLEMAGLGMLLPLLQVLTEPERVSSFPLLGELRRMLAPNDPVRFVVFLSAGLAAFFLMKNIAVLGLVYVHNRFVARKESAFIARLFASYVQRPYPFFLDHNSAELQRNLVHSTTNAFSNGLLALLQLALEAVTAVAICALLFYISPGTASAVGLVVAGALYGLHRLAGPYLANWGAIRNALQRDVIQWIAEAIGSIKEMKVLRRERFFADQFAFRIEKMCRYQSYARTYNAVPRALVEMLATLLFFGFVIAYLIAGHNLADAIPVLGVYGAAALRLMPSLNRMLQYAGQVRIASTPINDLHTHLIGLEPRAEQKPAETALVSLPFTRSIGVEDLSFRYAGAPRPALENVTFTIARNETIGLVGASGAGKSTLVDILLGLLPPSGGRISVDGTDIARDVAAWQRLVGFVPQRIFLSDDSLRRNIAFGLPDDAIDDTRLREVLKFAHLEDFVAGLPRGLNTPVGENGVRLSGGQRQRIGIARALYHDPELLILDEATSALDAATERDIGDSLDRLSHRKTLIIIAHRMSTVQRCDRLLFLKDGRLADCGSYDELARRNPDFRYMAALADDPARSAPGTTPLARAAGGE